MPKFLASASLLALLILRAAFCAPASPGPAASMWGSVELANEANLRSLASRCGSPAFSRRFVADSESFVAQTSAPGQAEANARAIQGASPLAGTRSAQFSSSDCATYTESLRQIESDRKDILSSASKRDAYVRKAVEERAVSGR